MKKILLLLFVALALVALSAAFNTPASKLGFGFSLATNSCEQNYDCQKSGKSCSGNYGDKSCNTSSANSTCCAMGLYCINSTCVADTVGDWCHNISDCHGGGPFVQCQNNTCVQLGLPGDECSESSDCFYASSNCNDSVCTGLGVGAKCSPLAYACGANLYCQADPKTQKYSCQPQLATNAACLPGADICANGNICSVGGKCIAPFQGANGTSCYSDYECATDLTCQNSKCATFTAWTQTSCTNNSQCNAVGEACLCDEITGEQFCVPLSLNTGAYCGSDFQSALSCLAENNCSYYYYTGGSVPTLPADSCPAQNCKSSYKKAQSCGCSGQKDLYGNCFYSSYCGGFPVWAIIVIAIVGVILVLVVIVVIVMVMRRRRTYDTIA